MASKDGPKFIGYLIGSIIIAGLVFGAKVYFEPGANPAIIISTTFSVAFGIGLVLSYFCYE